jgi:hypothetical protein
MLPCGHDLPILQPHDQVGVLVDQRVVGGHQEGGALLFDDAPEQAAIPRAVVLSSSPVGSSASISDGWFASARARPLRPAGAPVHPRMRTTPLTFYGLFAGIQASTARFQIVLVKRSERAY